MRRLAGLACVAMLAPLGSLALTSCGAQRITQTTLMVGALVASPETQLAGQPVPARVTASVYLARRGWNPGEAPQPLSGAMVRVESEGVSLALTDAGDGTYRVEAAPDALPYRPGATYRFVAELGNASYAERVVAPDAEQIPEFHQGLTPATTIPGLGSITGVPEYLPVRPGQDLVLHRPAASGERTLAFVAVAPASEGSPGSPSYTDPAPDASGLLRLALSPGDFKRDAVTVPGAQAWPACPPDDYLVSVTGMREGKVEGNNLSVGSTAYAGSADAAWAHCAP